MIKYRTTFFWAAEKIKPVEIERETDASVFIKGRRRAKRSSCESYFDTWEEAKAHLMSVAESKLNSARRELERCQGYYGNIKGLKKPSDGQEKGE